jgi:hypothetical protein
MLRLLIPALLLTGLVHAQPVAPVTDFLRFVESAEGAALQTAVARYRHDDGTRVDLVGAVHIADRAYFDTLNRRFTVYDAVLYELIGGPHPGRQSNRVTAGDGLDGLRLLHQFLRQKLNLEGQLECIDYGAANFIHADLSAEAFSEAMGQRLDSLLRMWMKMMLAQTRDESAPQSLALLMRLLLGGDSATEMKRYIGRELDRMEPILASIEADGGTVLIGERNRHAIEIMKREQANGRRRLAIFYGAAHLPDLETRLQELGFRRVWVDYLTAWDLPARKS